MWAALSRAFLIAGQMALGSTFERWFGGDDVESKPAIERIIYTVLAALAVFFTFKLLLGKRFKL